MTRASFHPVKAAALLATAPEDVPWVWKGFLPKGTLVLLAAYMKVGKTTFAYALLIAVARGEPFLGFATKKGAVLILAVEEHARDVVQRLRRFGMHEEDPIHVHVGRLPNDWETLGQVTEFIRTNRISVVFIDTVSRFWLLENENDNAEVIRQVDPLLELARQTEAVVLLAHHERKQGGHGGRSIRGASALFAAVDQALILEERQGGKTNQRVLRTIGRYEEDSPGELTIELDGDQWRTLGSPTEVGFEATKTRVLAALSDGPQGVAELARAVAVSDRMIRKALADGGEELIREGKGTKAHPYTYRLPGPANERQAVSGPPKGTVGPETHSTDPRNSIPDKKRGQHNGPRTNSHKTPAAKNAFPDQAHSRGPIAKPARPASFRSRNRQLRVTKALGRRTPRRGR